MPELSDTDIASMTTPAWEQAKAALVAGETERAIELVDRAVGQWRGLQDYSINWITSLLSFVGREIGEEAVERALRTTGEEFVRPRRDTGVDWGSLPASARAKVIARAMVANFGTCAVEEDAEKITLSFHCGTGGRLIDDGRYDGDGYLVLREPAPPPAACSSRRRYRAAAARTRLRSRAGPARPPPLPAPGR